MSSDAENWEHLAQAIRQILTEKKTIQRFEQLYRDTCKIVKWSSITMETNCTTV